VTNNNYGSALGYIKCAHTPEAIRTVFQLYHSAHEGDVPRVERSQASEDVGVVAGPSHPKEVASSTAVCDSPEMGAEDRVVVLESVEGLPAPDLVSDCVALDLVLESVEGLHSPDLVSQCVVQTVAPLDSDADIDLFGSLLLRCSMLLYCGDLPVPSVSCLHFRFRLVLSELKLAA